MIGSGEIAIIYSVRILKTGVQAKILWHMDISLAKQIMHVYQLSFTI